MGGNHDLQAAHIRLQHFGDGHGAVGLQMEMCIRDRHEAVLAYARDFMINKGFTYVIPPFMMHGNGVQGVMSFPEMDAMMYKIEGEDLYLIGTSEHTMIMTVDFKGFASIRSNTTLSIPASRSCSSVAAR